MAVYCPGFGPEVGLELELGRIGIWSGQVASRPAAELRVALSELEALGYRTIWFPESTGREAFSAAGLVLASTRSMIAATGIANIYARDATAMRNGSRSMAEAYPGRFVMGLGVSHRPSVTRRGGDYARPLTRMREYLEEMSEAVFLGAEPGADAPIILAALGPRMLELAARRTWGAHPYFVPTEHTRYARKVMGPDAVLAPEQAVVLSADPVEAREIARLHTTRYLALDNYRNNLLRLGWTEEDVTGSGSDALVDAVVAWGELDVIRERIAVHFEEGADHVSIQVLNKPGSGFPIAEFRELTPALADLR